MECFRLCPQSVLYSISLSRRVAWVQGGSICGRAEPQHRPQHAQDPVQVEYTVPTAKDRPLWAVALQPSEAAKYERSHILAERRHAIHPGAFVWMRPCRPQRGEARGPRPLCCSLQRSEREQPRGRRQRRAGHHHRQQRGHEDGYSDDTAGAATGGQQPARELRRIVAEEEGAEQLALLRLVPAKDRLHTHESDGQRHSLRLHERRGDGAQRVHRVAPAPAPTLGWRRQDAVGLPRLPTVAVPVVAFVAGGELRVAPPPARSTRGGRVLLLHPMAGAQVGLEVDRPVSSEQQPPPTRFAGGISSSSGPTLENGSAWSCPRPVHPQPHARTQTQSLLLSFSLPGTSTGRPGRLPGLALGRCRRFPGGDQLRCKCKFYGCMNTAGNAK